MNTFYAFLKSGGIPRSFEIPNDDKGPKLRLVT